MPKVNKSIEDELNELGIIIDKFVNTGKSTDKRIFTNKVNKIGNKYGASIAKEHLISFMMQLYLLYPYNERYRILAQRIIPGRPFVEHSQSGRSSYEMGFYSERQVQAEKLPLSVSNGIISVNFFGFRKTSAPWLNLFAESVELPYIKGGIYSPITKTAYDEDLKVNEDLCIVKFHLIFQGFTFCYKFKNRDYHILVSALFIAFYPFVSVEYLYLTSKPLQYYQSDEREYEGLIVRENIKQIGFWSAYNFWEGCLNWYKRNHPEWFKEENWHWGLDARFDVGSEYGDNIWLTLDEIL